jgi:hypothetical protein
MAQKINARVTGRNRVCSGNRALDRFGFDGWRGIREILADS